MTKDQAISAKTNWLSQCLEFGWQKSDLDELSKVWDRFKDENGNLRKEPVVIPSPGDNQSLEESKRCQHELTVEKYFGLPESVQESDEIRTDFGQLVNLVAMAIESSRPSIDIVDELRNENPYSMGTWHGWNECCNKLQELLNQKEAK